MGSRSIVIACALACLHCGGSGGGGGQTTDGGDGSGGSGGAVTADNYTAKFFASLCAYGIRCNLFPDVASCETYYDVPAFQPQQQALIAAGTATFDATKAQTCLAYYAAVPCDVTDNLENTAQTLGLDCFAPVDGLGSAGAACEQSAECRAGFRCETSDCDAACCPGSCAADPLIGSGQSCATGDCQLGLYCNETTTNCTPLGSAGDSCVTSTACLPPLGCTGATCETLPAEGSACQDLCAEVGDHCSGSGACTKLGFAGASCEVASDCSPILTCDATGHCAALPVAGQPCADSGGLACEPGFHCNDTGSGELCVPLLAEGSACAADAQCLSDNCSVTCGPIVVCL